MEQSWSIIIFAYNEAGSIKFVVEKAIDFLATIPIDKKEIIIIDDGSTDNTPAIINQLSNEYPYIKLCLFTQNSGIGAALKAGYAMARFENICAIPGDGQFDIDEARAFRSIASNVCVSFYKTSHSNYGLFRKLLTKANHFINYLFFGTALREINWIKIYKKNSIDCDRLGSNSSFIESELVMQAQSKGFEFIEAPSYYLPRRSGESKAVNFYALVKIGVDVIRAIFRYSPKILFRRIRNICGKLLWVSNPKQTPF